MSEREREDEIEWEKKEEKIEIIQTLPVYKAKIVKIKIEFGDQYKLYNV